MSERLTYKGFHVEKFSVMTEDKENHNGRHGQLKAIREKMKQQLEEHFEELSTNPAPKRRQKLDSKVDMMRKALTDNYKMMAEEKSKHDKNTGVN
jgi:hypothetical protein